MSKITHLRGSANSDRVLSSPKTVKPSPVYRSYWKFAQRRQDIFFNRLENRSWPWTDDHILKRHKFTNAYRASDRVSQYLIRQVIYQGDQSLNEVFFRTILFKLFNKIETWELLLEELGEVSWKRFNFELFDRVLSVEISDGNRIYSAAYIMPSGGRNAEFRRKHQFHLRLVETMMNDRLPEKLGEGGSMEGAFKALLSYPSIGHFLAYQYVTDLNYSAHYNWSEMDFVCAGPGAKDGIRKCFYDTGPYSDDDVIRIMADIQEAEFENMDLPFKSLWGRPLQLIDCQNLFCEVDKYARVAHPEVKGISGRTRIKQKFDPQGALREPWYPPKWGINSRIQKELKNERRD